MKIAIVAPCSVPYVVGGAEKLWWGLAAHFNEHSEHQAELIKLPARENDLPSLIRSYESFAALDLSGFDLVISGKYPAWMVSHPRHVCYMLHRLRGLYDTYYGDVEVPAGLSAVPAVSSLLAFMRRSAGARSALAEFFGRWNELMGSGARPAGLTDFPGPLARAFVHWLDGIALAPGAISRYAAISGTVASRPGYFPEGVEVAVAYPPPHRTIAPGSRFEHFYTVSRLDAPKRIGIVVEAMRLVKTPRRLLIGGTGPEEGRLQELAKLDSRVELLGFQSDAQVRECYANALAVPFIPWNEDYGLIAVEAMQCAKPVITMKDSGGPCEVVQDGLSGLVCDHTAESLARAMQRLADDEALARELGQRARASVSRITWDFVADTLLAEPPAMAGQGRGPRHRIVVASTFGIFPPRHGGQSRSFHIYRALAPEFETVIVSVCSSVEPAFEGEIAPGVREVRIPKTPEHEAREQAVAAEFGTPVTDVVMPELHILTPGIREALERESAGACAVVASHPYFYPLLATLGLPVWYEAQDHELHLKTALFQGMPRGHEIIESVRTVEEACSRAAEIILCASSDDGEALVKEFGVSPQRIVDLPNGTDAQRIVFTGARARADLKAVMGIGSSPLAFFMGSGHWPNIEAVRRIMEFAGALPHVAFAVMGSVCYAFDPRMKPPNMLFLGEVDDVTRNLLLQAADFALNPMEHGSGTNLKMLDYFAAGLPVITTERGARGLRLQGERECLVRPLKEFVGAIEEVLGGGTDAAGERALAARRLVEEAFDWDVIVGRVKPHLLALSQSRAPAALVSEPVRRGISIAGADL